MSTSLASAPASKKKKKARVADLPVAGSGLGSFPVGCCVFIGGVWYIAAFRIGTDGAPFLRRTLGAPTSPGWSERPGPVIKMSADTTVGDSCWPVRIVDDHSLDAEADPIMGNLRSDPTDQESADRSKNRSAPE